MGSGSVREVKRTESMKNARRESASKAFTSFGGRTRATKSSFSQSNGPLANLTDVDWTDKISECPIFYPSPEEFQDPLIYLQKIATEASKYGICKIVSPMKASVPAAEVLKDFEFPTYVQPLRLAEWNLDEKINFSMGKRKYNFDSFKSMGDEWFDCLFPQSRCLSPKYLEKEFWLELCSGRHRTVEYAVNVDGTAFSSDPDDQLASSKWNLKKLPKLPDSILRLVKHEIPGITYPMLYIGVLFSMFAWHVEDHFLYSINYHHTGAPKTWYGVPGSAALHLERVVQDHVYGRNNSATDGMEGVFKEIAGKTTMFPPSILLQHNVPVYKAVQRPGEFVITFPRAYHAGFSNGFNCGEAVNFAIDDWFPFGAEASKCYSNLHMMAIVPYEELLCQEAVCLSKREGCSSEESATHSSVKNSFVQHMQCFNNVLRQLKDNNKISTMQLPDSHGTVICRTCKRDCHLAFLECSSCYSLECLFHEIKSGSVDCTCGGKRILYTREDLTDMEKISRRWFADKKAQEASQEKKLADKISQPAEIGKDISSKNCDLQSGEVDAKGNTNLTVVTTDVIVGAEGDDELCMPKQKKRTCRELEGLLFFYSSRKRTRTNWKMHKNGSDCRLSTSEVS